MVGVASTQAFHSWGKPCATIGTAAEIAGTRQAADWHRRSAGVEAKGPRWYDCCYLELADLDASEFAPDATGTWTRGLLIRRRIDDGELAYFATWCPAGTSIQTLVQVDGRRWAIEDGFETAKNELGWDHNETRSWHGWHRHVSLVMLAFTMLAAVRKRANQVTSKKSPTQPSRHRPN